MATVHHQLRKIERGSIHIWVVIALIVIVLGLLGFALWQQLANSGSNDTSNTTAASNNDSKGDSETAQTNTYTPTNSFYVKSFKYPSGWRVVDDPNIICKSFDYCASPPMFIVVDGKNKERMGFWGPQSATDIPIDEAAFSVAGDNGNVASDLTHLDGLQARKIEHTESGTVILVLINEGYGYINFRQSIDSATMNIFLSSWKWQ